LDLDSKIKQLAFKLKNLLKKLILAIKDYRKNYRNGVKKFGIWWTVFTISMWSIILIFIGTAILVVLFFLPRTNLVI
jgi:hypothetical protein